jgi:predicted secreted protein
MRIRRRRPAALVPALAAALAWPALAPVGAPAAAQEREAAEPAGTKVVLQESAGRTLTNDRARAFVRAEAEGLDPREVQDQVNRLMGEGLEAARAVEGVEAATEGYYVYYREDQRRWVGQQRLRLESGEPDRLLPLLGELQERGFLMDGLESYLSPEAAEAVTDELTVEAIGRVQERVRLLVDTLGHGSFRLEELRIGGAGAPPPMPMRAMALESGAAKADVMAPPAFEAGETRVEVQVDATAVLSP